MGAQPHGAAKEVTRGQNCSSINPVRPAVSKTPQVVSPKVGMLSMTSGRVTRSPSPQTLHSGNPGDGGIGAAAGAATGAAV